MPGLSFKERVKIDFVYIVYAVGMQLVWTLF